MFLFCCVNMLRKCRPLLTIKIFYMQTQPVNSTMIKRLLPFILFLTAFSFTSHAGGYAFEIYLNNKLLLKQQHKTVISGSPELYLTAANANDNLRILFTNCGMTRKARSIAIKDENNSIIKEWEFPNATTSDFTMTIPVKEILAVQKKKGNAALKIYYYSPDHFSEGQMLASLQPEGKKVALHPNDWKNKWPLATAGVFAFGALAWIVKRKSA
jgi:hypothetical protein